MSQILTKFKKWVESSLEEGASDIHLVVGHAPILRITKNLIEIPKEENLKDEEIRELAQFLMSEKQYQILLEKKDSDFSYNFQGKARFRINAFFTEGKIALAFRLIPSEIKTIDELRLPSVLKEFTNHTQGFVLITGASSQGKSTTLAALISRINHREAKHIITLEDPIEYVFEDDKSIIAQRELRQDVLSFPHGLRSTLREDPDVIVVGEMRDLATISTAITAAETGHLVFATLHTNDAAQTIHRLVDVFPAGQQNQVRTQLAGSLLGIVSQRLIPRIKGGVVPACEVLISTVAVANLIRQNKESQIPLVIQTSSNVGMIPMNRSLANLVAAGEISIYKALAYSLQPEELRGMLKLS